MDRRERTAIVADDLTGATDTGIKFAKSGLTTVMIVDLDESRMESIKTQILSVNSDTRSCTGEISYSKVHNFVTTLNGYGYTQYFKKIDSTLRGNPGHEIEAMMDAGKYDVAIIAPAAPDHGRIIKNGVCLVNGTSLIESESGKDAITPVSSSFIPDVLRSQCKRKIGQIRLETIREGYDSFYEAYSKCVKEGVGLIVCDTETNSDLQTIAKIPSKTDCLNLFVGSSGIAKYLFKNSSTDSNRFVTNSDRLVMIVGSMMETSVNQSEFVVSKGLANEIYINIDAAFEDKKKEASRVISEFDKLFQQSGHILLRTITSTADRSELILNPSDIKNRSQDASSFVRYLVKEITERYRVSNFFATGGDTFLNVLKAMGIKELELIDEVQPGIPLVRSSGESALGNINIISKSGGFGDKETLCTVIDYIKSHHS